MNLSGIKTLVTQTAGRSVMFSKLHSPTILSAVGVVGVVASVVLSSKATLKLEGEIDDIEFGLQLAREVRDDSNGKNAQRTYVKDVMYVYTKGIGRLGRLYAPAVTTGLVGIGCLLGAQNVLHKRNVALAAAYKSVEHGFNEYRKRVVEELGEDVDKQFRVDSLLEEVTVKDEKTGRDVSVKKMDPNSVTSYARFFDEYNANWSKEADMNLFFIKCQQNYANDKLQARGHLFLNEVYEMLGLDHSRAGAVVGWRIGAEGDNFVDFGIFDFGSDRSRAFVNGQERSLLLDFNVDGVIYDKIRER